MKKVIALLLALAMVLSISAVALADEKPVAVYAYCNLHGLWKADVE